MRDLDQRTKAVAVPPKSGKHAQAVPRHVLRCRGRPAAHGSARGPSLTIVARSDRARQLVAPRREINQVCREAQPALAACTPGERGREKNTWNAPIGDVKLTTWVCNKTSRTRQFQRNAAYIKACAGIALTYGCKADLLLPFPPPLPLPPPSVRLRLRFTPSPRPTPVPPGPRFTAVAPGPFAIRCKLPRRPCACRGDIRRSSQSQVRRFAFEVGDGGECCESVETACILGGYAGTGGGDGDPATGCGRTPGFEVAAVGGEKGMCIFESERKRGCRW